MDERIDSIANYLSGLGDPERDSGAASRPFMDQRLAPHEIDALYLQNDIAAIIVDELVEEALRNGFEIKDADNADPALVDDLYRLDVDGKFTEAAKTARLYGAAYLWVIINDGRELADEIGDGEVVQLIPYDQWDMRPHAVQGDKSQEGYGEPVLYRSRDGEIIHASRLLKFTGERLPRRLSQGGQEPFDSVLQRPWPSIRRFTDVENAIARIVQSFEVSKISIGGLAQAMAAQGGAELIEARMRLIARSRSILNMILLDADAGEQYSRDTASVAGLTEIRMGLAESVAKSARMPMTTLFGQAPSGLNTDGNSGIQAWHKRVQTYRAQDLTPQIDRLATILFRGNEPASWAVIWPALDEPSQRETAELRKMVAETDALYLDRGVRSPDQVARSRDGGAEWSMETESLDDDIDFSAFQEALSGVQLSEDD